MPCTVAICTAVSVSGAWLVQLLDAEDIGEGLQVLHARVFEGVGGLFTERRAIHQEQNAAEALRLEQTVDERDAGLGLAGAGRHGQQHLALSGLDACFDRKDGCLLIVAQRETVVERGLRELLVRLCFVTLEQLCQTFRRVPAIEGMAQVICAAQIAEPDAALGGELTQEWTAVR